MRRMVRVRPLNLWGGIAVLLILSGLSANIAYALSGSGTEADPWKITSLADFDEFAGDPNYWDDYTRLETDVNLAGRVYDRAVIAPDINDSESGFQGTMFTGVFDGNDHKIDDFICDANDKDYIGLFGCVDDPNSQVKNLGLGDPNINAGTGLYVGSLIGMCYSGNIANCYVEGGAVSGRKKVGGLIGWKRQGVTAGTVSQCSYVGFVEGRDWQIGGLIGIDGGRIQNSYCVVSVHGNSWVGGLVGYNNDAAAEAHNCYVSGIVSGDDDIGGLVGRNGTGALIANCYSEAVVSGRTNVGGLVGLNWGSEGWMYGGIFSCYASGCVAGDVDSNVGGLIGCCYGNRLSANFWDSDVNVGLSGIGDMTDPNVTGKTTAEMKQQSTFTDWDFINVWNIGENQTYPYLRKYSAADINKDKVVNFLDLCIVAEQWCSEE